MTLSSGDWFVIGVAVGLVPMTHLYLNRHDTWWRMFNALWATKIAPIEGEFAREIAKSALEFCEKKQSRKESAEK